MIRAYVLQTEPKLWECPMCFQHKVTHHPHGSVTTEMHICAAPSMKGAWAPFVPAGTKAWMSIEHREDYIRGDDVRVTATGDPSVMATVVHRDEGEDRFVYAPCAHMNRPRGALDGMVR